ncbi:DUF4192 domain-containing protein [Aestuariimicrobium soli]|uniref:DUF4192 domain-containing protein n=1 Tax=Aestuariimicrobium soli TaxID=2035834 RepID=UPI003EBFB937
MDKQTRVRATSPADLLALAPYLLGFEPTESVVVVAIDEGVTAGVARCDLSDLEAEPDLAARAWEALSWPSPGAHAIVLGYGHDSERVARVLQSAVGLIEQVAGGLLVDSVSLTDGHSWWSLTDEWQFDPAAGEPYDICPPAVVEAVTAGLTSSGTRDDLVRSVEGPSRIGGRPFAASVRSQERALRGLSDEDGIAMVLELLFRGMAAPAQMSDDEQARLVVLMQRIPWRDEAWLTQTRANAEDHQVLWHHLVGRTPAKWSVPLLALLGFSAWLNGHGALASIACQRALSLNPRYGMADLLNTILVKGVHPRLWASMPSIGPGPAA